MSGERAARLFYGFCVLAGASVMAANILSGVGLVPIGAYGPLYRVFVFRGGLALAGGLFALAVLLTFTFRPGRSAPPGLAFAGSNWTLRGLCVSTALALLPSTAAMVTALPPDSGFAVGLIVPFRKAKGKPCLNQTPFQARAIR